MKKLQTIQALRGIAVLAVVLFHLVTIEKKYGGANTILPNFFAFGMFGVDIFFVISGFVMVTVTRGKYQDGKQALRFIYNRVSRIYPLYWLYSLLVLGIFLINPSLVNSSQGNQVDITASFLLLPSHLLPLVMVGWTLVHEVYFYLIFLVILFLFPERKIIIALLLWGLAVVFFNLATASNDPLAQVVGHPLTIEFIGGCLLAKIFFADNGRKVDTRILLFATCIGLTASIYGQEIYTQSTALIEPQGWWRLLIFGIPAMLTVYCLTSAEKNGFVLHYSLEKVGDASYSIYLSHVLTLNAAGRIWAIFANDSVYDNAIMIPLLLLLVLIVGILSHHYVEKPLLSLTQRVTVSMSASPKGQAGFNR